MHSRFLIRFQSHVIKETKNKTKKMNVPRLIFMQQLYKQSNLDMKFSVESVWSQDHTGIRNHPWNFHNGHLSIFHLLWNTRRHLRINTMYHCWKYNQIITHSLSAIKLNRGRTTIQNDTSLYYFMLLLSAIQNNSWFKVTQTVCNRQKNACSQIQCVPCFYNH